MRQEGDFRIPTRSQAMESTTTLMGRTCPSCDRWLDSIKEWTGTHAVGYIKLYLHLQIWSISPLQNQKQALSPTIQPYIPMTSHFQGSHSSNTSPSFSLPSPAWPSRSLRLYLKPTMTHMKAALGVAARTTKKAKDSNWRHRRVFGNNIHMVSIFIEP